MHRQHAEGWSRREFLGGTLAGAGLLGLNPEPLAAGNDNAQVRPERLGSLYGPPICGRATPARRGLYRGPIHQIIAEAQIGGS